MFLIRDTQTPPREGLYKLFVIFLICQVFFFFFVLGCFTQFFGGFLTAGAGGAGQQGKTPLQYAKGLR
ncbi:hypothetical protein, partial [Enterobacter intestinihominis]